MPLIPSSRLHLSQRVSDRRFGDTVFGQVAVFERLEHTQDKSGICEVVIHLRVDLYSLLNGELQDLLEGNGLSSYTRKLYANNDSIVSALDGRILEIRDPLVTTYEQWMAKAEAYPEHVMLQGDFFEQLRGMSPMPIGIAQLITQHIINADTGMNLFA